MTKTENFVKVIYFFIENQLDYMRSEVEKNRSKKKHEADLNLYFKAHVRK